MSNQTVTCPYCNSYLPAPATAGTRLDCPRCGESFPYRSSQTIQASTNTPTLPVEPLSPAAEVHQEGPRWTNRKLGLTVLGVMLTMALLGLAFALATVASRRQHDFKTQPTYTVETPVKLRHPLELAALAYLPAGTNLVLGLDVAAANHTAAGQAFLDRAHLHLLGFGEAAVEQTTGLKRDNIDHIVLGTRTDEIRPCLVIRTRQPYDVAQLQARLKARGRTTVGAKEAYYFSLEKPRLEAVLWPANSRTLVIALSPQSLKEIPDAPAGDHLPDTLRTILKDRLSPYPQAWLAGAVEHGEGLLTLLASQLLPTDREAITGVRAFGFGLHIDPGVTVTAAFQCTDDTAAAALAKALAGFKGSSYLQVFGSDGAGRKIAEELAAHIQSEREGQWLLLHTEAGAALVRDMMSGKP